MRNGLHENGTRLCPLLWLGLALMCPPNSVSAQVCNVKVVTDANPDYHDMPSMIHSVTSGWTTPQEKCWAMFYWNHIARRQTSPMILHGLELTDPIRQFNDYGYTMCSTVAGINTAIWQHMGLPVRFWDITLHTVSECEYNGRWHIYDNSMSAIYTLCDGVTIASVEDVGREGACSASGGRWEPGHIARYHCLNATSANGFLTGADTQRDLAQEYRCFKPSGLKHRPYYNNGDWGHRYILNLRPAEEYTRYYHSLGDEPKYYVPNGGKDPESANRRYRLRGNGIWKFEPDLSPGAAEKAYQWATNVRSVPEGGVQPAVAGSPAEIVFKVQAANVATAQCLRATIFRDSAGDSASISVSTNNGRQWQTVWSASETGRIEADCDLQDEVNGAYEILVRVAMQAASRAEDVRLEQLALDTFTMLNSKTQPSLRLGRNEVYVGTGDQSDSIVFWPELQNDRYRECIVEEQNIAARAKHPGYQGVLFAQRPNEAAYVVYRIEAPQPITRVVYGGRFYNRARNGQIELSHSFDEGQTWHSTYTLTETEMPWDDIYYATVEQAPEGCRAVRMRYRLSAAAAGPDACSIYAVRMEVQHRTVSPGFQPLEVTFNWSEIQPDRTQLQRSHTQRIDQAPCRYVLNVGGVDHPVVESLRVRLASDRQPITYGYSDGRDVGGARHVDVWQTVGTNLLQGKPYQVSVPPTGQWGGSDPDGTKLTDGIVGPNYAGGISASFGCIWDQKSGQPEITVDMGEPASITACRIHLTAGWPWWDALRGEVQDEVELFTSLDGEQYTSRGKFDLNLWRKDVPINHLLPDEESARGWNYLLKFEAPVTTRFVRYRVRPMRALAVTEVQALDRVTEVPFEMRVVLPGE